ncbi:hypothetical protein Y032_0819g2520 [Ancylostoma ceylanicum]|uniref:Uncharacterized protein n=1 Tax=Ancylostoma ceylanicum TaxID=53326 RepID=A0A016WDT3_9BILA|nr:hypothetical protein Y032_0819g2520 [Ancylostoma ceylanicum]
MAKQTKDGYVICYRIDHVTLRDAGGESWFVSLASLGYAFMNPSPGTAHEIRLFSKGQCSCIKRILLISS